jgi:superfamily I DNA/RNA helicase
VSGAGAARIPINVLDNRMESLSAFTAVGTTHLAIGLEFRAVVVMACDDDVVPLQTRIESAGRGCGSQSRV